MKYPAPCCSDPAKVIFWLYPQVPSVRERSRPHRVPSRDPQGRRAALGAGASSIGQKQRPKMLGGVWLSFPDVKRDGTVCVCGFVIAGTGFWGCDFELSSQFGIRVCLFHDLEHSRKLTFCPALLPSFLKIPLMMKCLWMLKRRERMP